MNKIRFLLGLPHGPGRESSGRRIFWRSTVNTFHGQDPRKFLVRTAHGEKLLQLTTLPQIPSRLGRRHPFLFPHPLGDFGISFLASIVSPKYL